MAHLVDANMLYLVNEENSADNLFREFLYDDVAQEMSTEPSGSGSRVGSPTPAASRAAWDGDSGWAGQETPQYSPTIYRPPNDENLEDPHAQHGIPSLPPDLVQAGSIDAHLGFMAGGYTYAMEPLPTTSTPMFSSSSSSVFSEGTPSTTIDPAMLQGPLLATSVPQMLALSRDTN
jgi:hypothetical protein